MAAINPVHLRLTDDQIQYLAIIAKKEDRKLATMARIFVNECLEEAGFSEWVKQRDESLTKIK